MSSVQQQWPGESTPNISTGWDEPANAPLLTLVVILLFLQLTAQQCQACTTAGAGAPQPQRGAEQEVSHGQEKGRLRDAWVSREQTPAPAFLLPQEEALSNKKGLPSAI